MAALGWPFFVLLVLNNVQQRSTEVSLREKRQISYPMIYQIVHDVIEEANQELAVQKQIDKYMMDTGEY